MSARLVREGPLFLLYALGDEESEFPFQHVKIFPRTQTIQWFVSYLPGLCSPTIALKVQHRRYGVAQRSYWREIIAETKLKLLHQQFDGDFFRTYQRCRMAHRPTPHSEDVMVLLWIDVMRHDYTLLSRRLPLSEESIQSVVFRLHQRYPYPHVGRALALRQWWFRKRLLGRLCYHNPVLQRGYVKKERSSWLRRLQEL
jgi:hypothetical protein